MTTRQANAPPPPPPPPARPRRTDCSLDSRVAVCSYLIICLNTVFFTALNLTDRWLYDALNQEDNWTENLTALWFLLAGLLLAATACRERSWPLRWVYMLATAAFLFAAGEEISWGQRLFGWATPEFLRDLNDQGETNIHNIYTHAFRRLHAESTTLLCAVAAAALCYRQNRLFGIPLPSLPLLLGFLLLRLYEPSLFMPVRVEQGLLLLLVVFALTSGQPKWFILVGPTLALNLTLWYVYGPRDVGPYAKPDEVYEYLLGLACLCYALELLLAQRRQAAASSPQSPGARHVRSWLAACALVMAGSVGLAVGKYVQAKAEVADFQRTRQWIASGRSTPLARSHFDFHVIGNRLVYYLGEPCLPTGTYRSLHMKVDITPVNSDDLPGYRKSFGYDDRDHYFFRHATFNDEGCLSSVPLPDYPIAKIRVRQYARAENGEWRRIRWTVFNHPEHTPEDIFQTMDNTKRIIDGAFSVYLYSAKRQIVYVRQPCADEDTAARFFLHVVPVDIGDLPDHRKLSGFENLDFGFHAHGDMTDGQCKIRRVLPDYPIFAIRTGQYTAEGQIWKGEHRAGGKDSTP